jgi:PBP1b-binding outer membrane lipoprotein LpoB
MQTFPNSHYQLRIFRSFALLPFSRRVAFVLLSSLMIVGCASTPPTDPNYQPARGQSGKDVIWIPTPPELVEKMLTMAEP